MECVCLHNQWKPPEPVVEEYNEIQWDSLELTVDLEELVNFPELCCSTESSGFILILLPVIHVQVKFYGRLRRVQAINVQQYTTGTTGFHHWWPLVAASDFASDECITPFSGDTKERKVMATVGGPQNDPNTYEV
ncbi:hypothetical protein B0H19DRAFT_1066541 [Mycena capillaripes]|nr:hypothetical protein B0H19DRAFT_1066541 [Mycena capillaripes]